MENALDLDRGDRGPFDRGEQDAPQRVPDRRPETSLVRLRHESTVGLGQSGLVNLEILRLLEALIQH